MQDQKLGFIGLGVMGEPMCRNLAAKARHAAVVAFDLRPEPLARLATDGVAGARSIAAVAAAADIIFLSLPGEAEIRAVCLGPQGLAAHAHDGQAIVDCSTAPVALARELAAAFDARGAHFADAPVARTRQAAIDGTLSVMVGADDFLYHRIEPLLRRMATDVTERAIADAVREARSLGVTEHEVRTIADASIARWYTEEKK